MNGSRAVQAWSIALLAGSLAGCSWFARKPTPIAAPAILQPEPAAERVDVQTAEAARAACANYAEAVLPAPFPRDAVIAGLDAGQASVRFAVDGTTVSVLSVTSSHPAFGNAATDVVRTLRCTVDKPTIFEIPFAWRTRRTAR